MMSKSRKPNRIQRTGEEWVITVISYLLVTLFALCCLFPIVNLFAKAVSSESAVLSGKVFLIPKDFQMESIRFILNQSGFQIAFMNSLFVTVASTAIAILVTVCAAYPLSIRGFRGRHTIQFLLTFTMIFNGGLIPGYLLLKDLNLLESHWGLIWPSAVVPFWIIIMRSGFEGIPDAISESAYIDGASHFTVLIRVLLPLIQAQIATMVLMFSVDMWNEYFNAMIVLHKKDNFTLQVYLQNLLTKFTQSGAVSATQMKMLENQAAVTMQGAAIFLSILPVLFIYPFLQKYFVKGMTLGAVKG